MHSTGAHLGSGVDVQGFRRIRDQFLDLQFRGQNTSLSDWKAQTEALDTAELALAEPGDTGISAQLANFWNAWSELSKSPDSTAAKQALVQKAGALTDAIHTVRSQMVAAQETAQGQYDVDRRPRRRRREDRDRARGSEQARSRATCATATRRTT